MAKRAFDCNGGDILYGIGLAWFVSYAYHNTVDRNEKSWNSNKLTANSRLSRRTKYNDGRRYHHDWLLYVLSSSDNKLSTPTSKIGLSAFEIKRMASELLAMGV